MQSCFMFGHRTAPYSILPRIVEAIENYYTMHGITTFYVGSRGQFDSLAAIAANQIKQRHPDIQLILVLAYHPAERPVYLSDGFDNSYYPPLENIPRQYAIVMANRYMVNTVDTMICYVRHPGNTRNLLEYAQQRQKKEGIIIENVAEVT